MEWGASFLATFHTTRMSSRSTETELFPHGRYLGLRVLSSPSLADLKVDIIFLHGITGHPYRTFACHNGAYWPVDFLSKDVPAARILSFGYDASVNKFLGAAGQSNIREHAASLISDLAALRLHDGTV